MQKKHPAFPTFVSAYSSNHTPGPPPAQLHENQDLALLTLKMEEGESSKALRKHKTEARKAEKELESKKLRHSRNCNLRVHEAYKC